MAPLSNIDDPAAPWRGRLALAISLALVALIWLCVLPWIGRQEQLAERIRREQAAGIDPSAMFYTELEMMPSVIRRMERMPSLSAPLTSSAAPYNSPGSRRTPGR